MSNLWAQAHPSGTAVCRPPTLQSPTGWSHQWDPIGAVCQRRWDVTLFHRNRDGLAPFSMDNQMHWCVEHAAIRSCWGIKLGRTTENTVSVSSCVVMYVSGFGLVPKPFQLNKEHNDVPTYEINQMKRVTALSRTPPGKAGRFVLLAEWGIYLCLQWMRVSDYGAQWPKPWVIALGVWAYGPLFSMPVLISMSSVLRPHLLLNRLFRETFSLPRACFYSCTSLLAVLPEICLLSLSCHRK